MGQLPALEMHLGTKSKRPDVARLMNQDGLQLLDGLVGPTQGEQAFGPCRGNPRVVRSCTPNLVQIRQALGQMADEEFRLGESKPDILIGRVEP